MDKRILIRLLTEAKEECPDKKALIESIENEFHSLFESISPRQKLMLRSFPIQYVKKIPQEDGEWTSQLHIWAEECVPEILKLDPIFLAFKNSKSESVLMSFVIGATGTHTGIIRYDLIQKMLEQDYSYQDESMDKGGAVIREEKNPLDEQDANDQTIFDYLIDIAFGTGEYEGEEPDPTLQQILRNYLAVREQIEAENEEMPISRVVMTSEQKPQNPDAVESLPEEVKNLDVDSSTQANQDDFKKDIEEDLETKKTPAEPSVTQP